MHISSTPTAAAESVSLARVHILAATARFS